MTKLKSLLSEAGTLPNAEALWEQFVLPSYPHLELCNYTNSHTGTWLAIRDSEDGASYHVEWEDDGDDLCVSSPDDYSGEDAADVWSFPSAIADADPSIAIPTLKQIQSDLDGDHAALFLPIIDNLLAIEI